MARHDLRDASVWAVSGAIMFGLLAGLGTLFSYDPPIFEIEPSSPGRTPLYVAASIYAVAGALFGIYAYLRSRSIERLVPGEEAPSVADFFMFLVGIPVALCLLAFVPPESVHVASGDIRAAGSLTWRLFIGFWVGLVATSMTIRSARFYIGFLFWK